MFEKTLKLTCHSSVILNLTSFHFCMIFSCSSEKVRQFILLPGTMYHFLLSLIAVCLEPSKSIVLWSLLIRCGGLLLLLVLSLWIVNTHYFLCILVVGALGIFLISYLLLCFYGLSTCIYLLPSTNFIYRRGKFWHSALGGGKNMLSSFKA